jgi:predicted metal-binding membrane protein
LRVAIWIVLYVALIVFAPLPDRLVLFPTTDHIDAGTAVRKTIPFKSGELEIWTARSALGQQRVRAARRPSRHFVRNVSRPAISLE